MRQQVHAEERTRKKWIDSYLADHPTARVDSQGRISQSPYAPQVQEFDARNYGHRSGGSPNTGWQPPQQGRARLANAARSTASSNSTMTVPPNSNWGPSAAVMSNVQRYNGQQALAAAATTTVMRGGAASYDVNGRPRGIIEPIYNPAGIIEPIYNPANGGRIANGSAGYYNDYDAEGVIDPVYAPSSAYGAADEYNARLNRSRYDPYALRPNTAMNMYADRRQLVHTVQEPSQVRSERAYNSGYMQGYQSAVARQRRVGGAMLRRSASAENLLGARASRQRPIRTTIRYGPRVDRVEVDPRDVDLIPGKVESRSLLVNHNTGPLNTQLSINVLPHQTLTLDFFLRSLPYLSRHGSFVCERRHVRVRA
jgi:hypothetical protein